MENGNNRQSQLKYLVFSVKIFRLTVDCEQGGVRHSLPRHVARDAAVVGRVRQLGLGHQELAFLKEMNLVSKKLAYPPPLAYHPRPHSKKK